MFLVPGKILRVPELSTFKIPPHRVCPSIFDPNVPMSKHTHCHRWKRILERAGPPHIGRHVIRHRSASDIANSGVPVKVGMELTTLGYRGGQLFRRVLFPQVALTAIPTRRSNSPRQ
ncbi:MAG: hypothetical protein E5Y12_04585 [Mesorhizobium sp.]|nr:MAG: hypothetical protein E5Y12_04585 [Mesorhizobium sp.]